MKYRNDFTTWLDWFRAEYPDIPLSALKLKEIYDAFYFCNCDSCLYLKEKPYGYPTNLDSNGACKLPHPTPNFDPIKLGIIQAIV